MPLSLIAPLTTDKEEEKANKPGYGDPANFPLTSKTSPSEAVQSPVIPCYCHRLHCHSMGFSVAVLAVTSSLHLIAFVLAIGAERRRSTGTVVPDEYDDRTFCVYDSDASTVYGLSAFAALLISQAVMTAATKCLCFGRGLPGGGVGVGSRACTVASFAVSWLCFLAAEGCLVAGSVRNAYHTKYIGYYEKKDLTSCIALRKGVFAAAAAFVLISLVSSLSFYWSYAKADTFGWVKHQNEGGVGMAEYGQQDKGELRNSNI